MPKCSSLSLRAADYTRRWLRKWKTSEDGSREKNVCVSGSLFVVPMATKCMNCRLLFLYRRTEMHTIIIKYRTWHGCDKLDSFVSRGDKYENHIYVAPLCIWTAIKITKRVSLVLWPNRSVHLLKLLYPMFFFYHNFRPLLPLKERFSRFELTELAASRLYWILLKSALHVV